MANEFNPGSLHDQEVLSSLINWLNTFSLSAKLETSEQLSTGLAIAEALNDIDSSFFNDEWMSRLAMDADEHSNWRVKSSNLKKLWNGMSDYVQEVLAQSTSHFTTPDFKNAAEKLDARELRHILQQLLGIAINCDRKQTYIERVRGLEETVQQMIMLVIQDQQGRERPRSFVVSDANLQEEHVHMADELRRMKDANDELRQRVFELDNQVTAVQEERDTLQAENERLMARLTDSENLDDPNSAAGRRLLQLSQQAEQLHEETFRLEHAKEDFRLKAERLEKENKELAQRLEESSHLDHENQKLQDHVDELKARVVELQKYQTTADTLKRKVEELSDLKSQVKLLEEKNSAYMKCGMDLEEEQRKTSNLRTQLESYKAKLKESETGLSDATKRMDKAEFDLKRTQEKHELACRERDRLQAERDALRDENEELHFSQLHRSATSASEETVGDALNTSVNLISAQHPDLRERILRLELENRQLKEAGSGAQDLLQSQLDEALSKQHELESDLRAANRATMELQSRLDELSERASGSEESTDARWKEKHRQVEALTLDNAKLQQALTDAQKRLKEKEELVGKQDVELSDCRSQHRILEDRYRQHMEKARTLVEAMEQQKSLNPADSGHYSRADVEALKRELQDKENLISRLQEDQERTRILREQEERLITTAFQSMAIQLHRRAADDRLSSAADGNTSFLARQRQIVTRRPMPPQSNAVSNRKEGIAVLDAWMKLALFICLAVALLGMTLFCRNFHPDAWFSLERRFLYMDGHAPV